MIDPGAKGLWGEFLKLWPADRLKTMTLAEYTAAKKQDTFTYWIESKTETLGSIWGGSAFKFGVFSRDENAVVENEGGKTPRPGLSYNDDYGWYTKYGEARMFPKSNWRHG